jgi:hypothetical protein
MKFDKISSCALSLEWRRESARVRCEAGIDRQKAHPALAHSRICRTSRTAPREALVVSAA